MTVDMKKTLVCSVDFSTADGEYVGKCAAYPSLSHLALTREAALLGIADLVGAVEADMAADAEAVATGRKPPCRT